MNLPFIVLDSIKHNLRDYLLYHRGDNDTTCYATVIDARLRKRRTSSNAPPCYTNVVAFAVYMLCDGMLEVCVKMEHNHKAGYPTKLIHNQYKMLDLIDNNDVAKAVQNILWSYGYDPGLDAKGRRLRDRVYKSELQCQADD